MNNEQIEAKRVVEMRSKYTYLKWVGTWSKSERKFRIARFVFVKGYGPGWGAPANYSGKLSIALEFKLQVFWIGAFWKSEYDTSWHIWICIIPCLPVHVHLNKAFGAWHA